MLSSQHADSEEYDDVSSATLFTVSSIAWLLALPQNQMSRERKYFEFIQNIKAATAEQLKIFRKEDFQTHNK